MNQEDKYLLLRDICARLPYGVKILTHYKIDNFRNHSSIETLSGINIYGFINSEESDILRDIGKPYLFPLSSMTEEQKYDFYCNFIENDCDFDDFKEFYFENNEWHKMLTSIDDCESIIDWFNKNHFDYRCLIPKGLAIDATGKNIY